MISGKLTQRYGLAVVLLIITGCAPKHAARHISVLPDPTADCVNAPGAEAAWNDGFHRVNGMIPELPVGGTIVFYTMADTKTYTPMPVLTWVKDMENGKQLVSARSRKIHNQDFELQEGRLFEDAKSNPVRIETRLVESIYEISRSMCDQDGCSSDDVLEVISDMENYSDAVRNSHVIQSDESMKACISEVVKSHPNLGPKAPRVLVVYKPSIEILKAKPVCIRRLKTFWLAYFKAIGCTHVEWVSPKPQAPITKHPRT